MPCRACVHWLERRGTDVVSLVNIPLKMDSFRDSGYPSFCCTTVRREGCGEQEGKATRWLWEALCMHSPRDLPTPPSCRAQGSTARVNPNHSTCFPFPLPQQEKKVYFLQGDDDFAVLWATLPVAKGFSRCLDQETLKACVFPPKSTLSILWVLMQFKLSGEECADSLDFSTNRIG